MKTLSLAALCAVLLALGAAPAALSAQTLRLNLEQLEDESELVVLGKAVRAESAWTSDRSAILTRVVLDVQHPETGEIIGQETVVVPGGQVGEFIHEVSDMPFFRVDEEVAVFLSRHVSGELIVAGGWQGKLDVVTDSETGEKKVLGASYLLDEDVKGFANKQDAKVAETGAEMTVGDFARRVGKLKRER